MPSSWKRKFYGGSSASSRRGSIRASSANGDSVSAVYAAASGLNPTPSERKKTTQPTPERGYRKDQSSLATTTTPLFGSWLPQRLGKFDRPIVLRESDALPELLDGVFERNKAIASGSSRATGSQRP